MTTKEVINSLKLINLGRVHPFLTWEEMLYVRDTAIEALEKTKWISVTEKLPSYFQQVLLWDAIDQDVFMGELDGDGEWFVRGYSPDDFNITHWMPLPEPPERDDE